MLLMRRTHAIVRSICVDIDNVIARTDEVMRRIIEEVSGNRVRLEYADVVEFDYCKCRDKFGNSITPAEWLRVHQAFSDPRYLWQIEVMPGAVEGLTLLAEYGRLHLATSRLPKARRSTVEWLEYYSLPSHDLHFVHYSEKHVALGRFAAAIEDNYSQAVAFASCNTPCFLLRHPWNAAKPYVDGVTWVDGWSDLTEELLKLCET